MDPIPKATENPIEEPKPKELFDIPAEIFTEKIIPQLCYQDAMNFALSCQRARDLVDDFINHMGALYEARRKRRYPNTELFEMHPEKKKSTKKNHE